ncbi:hypothetical protein HNY73_015080 [Argiope bruennichi]|uniref:Uncharacterized protein n=1 Tax=Argiope bruennichi TaxID=94029 RepID=A0A8T0EWE3_ARGBR|nr:hypothetical protein HNY73_015080 [Argiope bruennichi]
MILIPINVCYFLIKFVYHHCSPSGMMTLTCSEGDAFDYVTAKCIDAFLVDCGGHSGRFRRSSQQSSLLGKLILPIMDEMMSDKSTKRDLQYIFNVAKSSYESIRQVSKKSQVHRDSVLQAKRQFMSQTKSTIERLLDKHFVMILRKIIGNRKVLYSNMGTVKDSSGTRSEDLKNAALEFVKKHPLIIFSSFYFSFASQERIAELKRDFIPVKNVAFDIIEDYLDNVPNNRWLWFVYESSFVSKNF